MMRAAVVSASTVAGLVAVLSYSGGEPAVVVGADVPLTDVPGLGEPSAEPSATSTPLGASAKTTPTATPSRSRSPKPSASASAKAQPSPSPTATPTATREPSKKPNPTKKPKPAPSPSPTRSTPPPANGDFDGPAVTFKYGTLQMGIRVVEGRVVDAWAISYPLGDSRPYSEMAIPILREQTIGTTSANIAGATGASLTSNAWSSSLAGALSRAGIR